MDELQEKISLQGLFLIKVAPRVQDTYKEGRTSLLPVNLAVYGTERGTAPDSGSADWTMGMVST